MIVIQKVNGSKDKRKLLPLLLLGDEQESMIERYLDRAEVFVLRSYTHCREVDMGVIAVTDEGDGVLEIKNIAIAEGIRGSGLGRYMIQYIGRVFSARYHTLLVGTGDSLLTVPFYERCGFVRSHAVKDFFTEHYDHPIIEGGVQLRDMVYFKKSI